MFYNWYDPHDRRRRHGSGRRTAAPVTPFLSSVDNGWLAAALMVVARRRAGAARQGGRILLGRWTSASTTTRPRAAPIGPRRPDPRRLLGRPSRPAARCWTTTATAARTSGTPATTTTSPSPSRASPATSASRSARSRRRTTSHACAPSRTTCDWSLAGDAAGRLRHAPTSACRCSRAPTATAASQFVPSWGGDMFEALMPDLFVPEARWGPRSWGRNHPATVRGADRARPERRQVRLLGLLPRLRPVRRLPASTASTRWAWTPTATRPTWSAPSTTPASATAARPARAADLRRRRGDPARRVPGRCRTPRGAVVDNLAQADARTSTPTARAASTTRSRCAAARSPSGTCPSTRP